MCLFCAANPVGDFYATTRDGERVAISRVASWLREQCADATTYQVHKKPYSIVLMEPDGSEWEPFFLIRDRYDYDKFCGRGFFLDVLYAQQTKRLVEKL